MSMSTYICGIVPPNDTWLKMKAVHDACRLASVDVPDVVTEFFNGDMPDDKGVIIDISNIAEKYSANGEHGFEIDIEKVPKHIKTIRFINSW